MARPRAQIDAAALADAFAADGLHGTTSATLAAAVGVAKPTLYVHGESKAMLFLRAVEAEVERVLDRLHAAEVESAGRSARDRTTAAALALLDHAAARPAGARLLSRTARHASSPSPRGWRRRSGASRIGSRPACGATSRPTGLTRRSPRFSPARSTGR